MSSQYKPGLRGLALAGAVAALALTGPVAEARSLAETVASGTIRIGIQGDNCPWGCINSAGKADGYDADMGTAFADYLGVKAEFVPLAVANRIPALATDKVDVLFATMGMTAERAQSLQYSQPYAANQMSVVGPVDLDLSAPDKLPGHKYGVPRAASQDTALTAIAPAGTDILRFDDDAATIQALLSGQVDAVGANQFYLDRLEQAAPGRYKVQLELVRHYNGVGSRLGEKDWNESLNAFLDQFMQTDEYKAIYNKWMHMDPPDFPTEMEGIPYTVQN